MKIDGTAYRTIEYHEQDNCVQVIDQTKLPFQLTFRLLKDWQDIRDAIATMVVRGAPLIGVTAAYGLALAVQKDSSDENLHYVAKQIKQARPTAVNLAWAVQAMLSHLQTISYKQRPEASLAFVHQLAEQDVKTNSAIGDTGLHIIQNIAASKQQDETVHILTHCNAGWLGCVDWGTALAPLYKAYDAGIKIHVYVDETRPRNQGLLTMFELEKHGVPCSYIVDNAGGYLMQQGLIDCCIVGTDRVTANGDVVNKVGTYLKALAARDCNLPFYVALPPETFDPDCPDGNQVEIEERDGEEIRCIQGFSSQTKEELSVRILDTQTKVKNPAFDITPACLISGYITPQGLLTSPDLKNNLI